MITLQLPPAAAKQAQPAAPAQATTANPAPADADPAIAAKEHSLFAFLLAQQTAAGAVPGLGKSAVTADATEKESPDDAKAGDAAAAAPWMWLHTPLPREAACLDPKSAPQAGAETALETTARPVVPAATSPAAPGAQALAVTPESATAQSAAAAHKSAADELAALAAVAEAPAQRHGTELPVPALQVQAQPSSQSATNAVPAPTAPPVAVPIESKVGTPRWTRDIHQSVSMLVQSRTSVAELRLTPADMGPIQIRIDFSEKQPSVSISVQQADTRNALDAALPRLRDMMAESGITLGGAGVEQHGRPSDTPGDQARFAWQGREQAAPLPVAATDQFAPQVRTIALDQLVDTYA